MGAQRYVLLTCVADEFFMTAAIALLGGPTSPIFTFLFVFPVIHALTFPLHPRAILASGLAAAAGYVALSLSAQLPPLNTFTWVFLTGIFTYFGLRASEQAREVIEARALAHVERERREQTEHLATSSYERAQSEKLMLLGRLAANVLHELNNPLAYVRSSVDFLRQAMLSHPQEHSQPLLEAFDEAQHGLQRIQEIASDLRRFSRLDGGELAQCALAEVVEDASRIAALRLKHVARLQVQVPEGLPEVQASPRKLAQVLVNLLVNAADALEEAGRRDGEVRLQARQQQALVELRVEDNGPGFPPHVLQRLFQPFFTTKGPEKGTGLGLSVSRELVESFGGSLVAENRPEGGACLLLTLKTLAT